MKVTMENNEKIVFIVIRKCDSSSFVSLMDENALCEYLNMLDLMTDECYSLAYVKNQTIRSCHFVGWQPNCLIEVADTETNEVIMHKYGEDH